MSIEIGTGKPQVQELEATQEGVLSPRERVMELSGETYLGNLGKVLKRAGELEYTLRQFKDFKFYAENLASYQELVKAALKSEEGKNLSPEMIGKINDDLLSIDPKELLDATRQTSEVLRKLIDQVENGLKIDPPTLVLLDGLVEHMQKIPGLPKHVQEMKRELGQGFADLPEHKDVEKV